MDLLRTFLGSLPAGLAGKVARAVEVDRLNNGKMLPHDLILESLRPSLRDEERAERTHTPMRLFCQPFEDLLANDQKSQKLKGRISRSSITPVWNWLAQDLIPDVLNAFSLAVKTAAMGYGTEDLETRAAEFWKTASSTMRAKLASESGRRAARQAVGGDAIVEDAREMAIMLQAGPEICRLQERLARRVPSLTDDIVRAFREIYEEVALKTPEVAPYLPLVVMKRLEHPWEALRLPLEIPPDSEAGATASTNSELGMAGEILFGAIEAHAAAILAAQPNQFNADILVAHVEAFATLSAGVAKEIELRRDGAWGQRLVKDRAAVAEAMDNLMERAAMEIFAALPMLEAADGTPRVPDMSQPADPEKSDRALSYARLLAGCRSFASSASFAASLKRADEEAGVSLQRYNEDIVRALRDASDEQRFNAEQFAALATELTAILFSPEEGEFLRRRGRAAVSEPVAA
ncbi:MAG: hypothetical protein JO208_13840 [Alphaproteobacteria bacterium]|nr:hypothetical protein [Alphaproteobacteria bacterium]